MIDRIRELAKEHFCRIEFDNGNTHECYEFSESELEKFAELIVQECIDQVEQAKNSPFVSLDDSKRMSHFVDVTKKKIKNYFGVKE